MLIFVAVAGKKGCRRKATATGSPKDMTSSLPSHGAGDEAVSAALLIPFDYPFRQEIECRPRQSWVFLMPAVLLELALGGLGLHLLVFRQADEGLHLGAHLGHLGGVDAYVAGVAQALVDLADTVHCRDD